MTLVLVALVFILIPRTEEPLMCLIPTTSSPKPYRLAEDAWKRRPLLIFAPTREDAAYRHQMERLRGQRAELVDRDMRIVVVRDDQTSRAGDFLAIDQTNAESNDASDRPRFDDLAESRPISADEVQALQRRFGVPENAFRVVLVGKDTTAKSRFDQPVDPARIYGQIDAMPMRRQEMRQRADPRP